MKVDLESLSFEAPIVPKVLERFTFSALEHRCMDLSGNLITENETFLELASELEAKEPLTVDLGVMLQFTPPPSPQPKSPSPVSVANEQA